MLTLDLLKKKLRSCKKCEDLVRSRKQVVPGDGAKNADIFIIGLAPGKDGADITGIPFTRDPSGNLLRQMLESIHLSRERDVYITNIVKCNPKNKRGNNRNPTSKEIINCCDYLKAELDLINPKIIVTLGAYTTKYFLGKANSMKKCRGRIFQKGRRIIYPLYHPGFIVRNAYPKTKYVEDFGKLNKLRRKLN